jgi:nucleoside 2-deoxyribosyltransferase
MERAIWETQRSRERQNQGSILCFDAFSSREPEPTSLENALKRNGPALRPASPVVSATKICARPHPKPARSPLIAEILYCNLWLYLISPGCVRSWTIALKTLDDQIADIEKLDELRQRARTLRREAIDALTAWPYEPRRRDNSFADNDAATRPGWELPGDDVEKAEVLRALARLKAHEKAGEDLKKSHDAIIEYLMSIKLKDLGPIKPSSRTKPLDSVPIFRCAMILQALAETPGQAFSDPALYCFYRIVEELNAVAAPDWMSGAARADQKSQATAFVTGECARALLALERALLQTADAAELLGSEAARQARSSRIANKEIKKWREEEEAFRKYSLDLSLGILPYTIMSPPDATADPAGETAIQKLIRIVDGLESISKKLRSLGLPEGKLPRSMPPADGMRTIVPAYSEEVAKGIAYRAVDQLLKKLAIRSRPTNARAFGEYGRNLTKQLKLAAQVIRDLLRPIEKFAESIIDRQIAAASPQLGDLVDGAELVFAATLLGLVSDWKRPKVRAASEVLLPLLSSNGRLLSIRPFEVAEKGYRLNAATLDVTRRLADLVAELDVEVQPEFVARLMLPFEYTRVPGSEPHLCGWTTDPPPREPTSLWWLTSIALDALESIVHMLDAAINRRVLGNFQVRQPDPLKLKLDDLFYPDYGLAKRPDRESVAVTLQKLRAHVSRGPAEEKPLFSLILFGPPGTGKTTLVEAVANTAGVPLVEVTPSDILVGGAEGVERRARQVFQALSKLTHVVILFDEFDSILLDRANRDPEIIPTSVIEFLTPGMLPKLKALNEASKQGRVSYMLATNFVDRLDPAVTRGGRFDKKCGIYPPDAVSRFGRLQDQLNRLSLGEDEIAKGVKSDLPRLSDRARRKFIAERLKKLRQSKLDRHFLETATKTASGPMDKLGRPGWYSMPRSARDFGKKSLFGHIFAGQAAPLAKIEVEADLRREADKYNEQRARKAGKRVEDLPPLKGEYWTEWKRIEDWDNLVRSLRENAKWSEVSATVERMLAEPSGLRVYLAGPEVFLPDPLAVSRAKIEACTARGFIGVSPVDNKIDVSNCSGHEAALRIAAANEAAIRSCDLMIANVTPFRGPSADVGTAYEIGFARMLGLPVFAYTNVAGTLLARMQQDPGAVMQRGTNRFEDRDHMAVEDYEGFDNLMLSGAIADGSPVVVDGVPADERYSHIAGLERCLELAATRFGLATRP